MTNSDLFSKNLVLTGTAALILASCLVPERAEAKDICWSEGPAQYADAYHTCVSSALRPQGRNHYGPKNLVDGNNRTAWCEGVRGPGIGQTVTIHIEGGPAFRRLMFQNGYGKSRKAFFDNNRIRTIEIATDKGVRTRATLVDQNQEYPVHLPRVAAHKWVKITILDVFRGRKYDDTCLTSVWADFDYEEMLLNRNQGAGAPQPPVSPPGIAPSYGNAPPPASDMFGGQDLGGVK